MAQRLAVLIDGENIGAEHAAALLAEIALRGEIAVRRLYGDFSGARLQQWTIAAKEYGLELHQHNANGGCKNASDIALVIDAMDLLHKRQYQGFGIVSSDSDFTRLAARIREEGCSVFGFGRRNTPQSFRLACTEFVCTDDLASAPRVFGKRHAATPLLTDVVRLLADAKGWAPLSEVGQQLLTRKPNYKIAFGHAKLIAIVRETLAFDVNHEGTHIRLKPEQKVRLAG
ncbi:MAG: NYN domain-containing protein [Alphaproteobacteria bacterium]|nr:NYN domain-containing protein [Alphaproteobacteria bacterium]